MSAVSQDAAQMASLPERARDVAELANEHAEYADAHGQLAAPVVDALHRNLMFGMWVPKSVPGGSEAERRASCSPARRFSGVASSCSLRSAKGKRSGKPRYCAAWRNTWAAL
jgi:hypothetical protein